MSSAGFEAAMQDGFPPPPRRRPGPPPRPRRPKPHTPTAREDFEAVFGPMATPIEAAHGLLDAAIDNFRDPAYRVEFFAAAVAMVPFARARLPFIPAMVLSIAAGKAARWAYESAEEVKAKLGDSNAPGRI